MKTTEIKVWMLKKGIRQMDIARDLGVTPQTVWQVLHGRCKSRRVTKWLLEHGCPPEFLGFESQEETERRAA